MVTQEEKYLERKDNKDQCFVERCTKKAFATWMWVDSGYTRLCRKHSQEEFNNWAKKPEDLKTMLEEEVIEEEQFKILEKGLPLPPNPKGLGILEEIL